MPHRMNAALVAVALAVAACVPASPIEETPAPQITLHGVRMLNFRESELYASGRAALVTYQRSTGEITATDAVVHFPRQGDARGLEIQAGRLEGSMTSRKATGSAGVVVRSPSGLIGRTERAQFDGDTLEAFGDAAVRVEGPGIALDARAFRFRFSDEEFDFTGGVTSRLGGSL